MEIIYVKSLANRYCSIMLAIITTEDINNRLGKQSLKSGSCLFKRAKADIAAKTWSQESDNRREEQVHLILQCAPIIYQHHAHC